MRYEHHVSFCGNLIETTATNKAAIADDWVHQILSMYRGQHLIIGLDCKRRPHPITSMGGRTATMQLCVGCKCLILQLLYMDYIPKSLKSFLSNPDITFVGVEVEENVLRLWGEYGLWCTDAADVHELASRSFPLGFSGKTGLKALACKVAKFRMWKPKNGCCGDWESKLLDERQIEQGCIDSYSVHRIGIKLLDKI